MPLQISEFDSERDNEPKPFLGDWPAFKAKLLDHREGDKVGPAFSCGTFNGKRGAANVVDRGVIALDVEPLLRNKGEPPPSIEEIARRLKAKGLDAAIYTTHSHTAAAPRYRVVVPLAETIAIPSPEARIADADAVRGFADALGLDAYTDKSKLFVESLMFYPRHAAGGEKPEAIAIDGQPLATAAFLGFEARGRELREAEEAADDARRGSAKAEAKARRYDSGEGNVIAAWNKTHPLAETLASCGYVRMHETSPHWRSEYQRSGSYATRVETIEGREFWISLSGSDAEAGVGARSKDGASRWGDSFDLFVHYMHGGDFSAAVRAAARKLGIPMPKPKPEPWREDVVCDDWDEEPANDNAAGETESPEDFDRRATEEDGRESRSSIRPGSAFIAEYTPAEYVVDNLLQRGFLYSLTAVTGAGKTALALLIATSVAQGRSFAGAEVKKGKVIYCAAENPDEFRQRAICLAERNGIQAIEEIHFLTPDMRDGILTKKGAAQVRAYAEKIGGVVLVIVDTAAAVFDGDDFNNNAQQGSFARRLRGLCSLPGKPTVLVLCHPVKNAKRHEELEPFGGGAFINEVDGNLTLMKMAPGRSEMFWSKKFRGRPPEKTPILLREVEAKLTLDAKGRPLRSVLAEVMGEEAVDRAEEARQAARERAEAIAREEERQRIVGIVGDRRGAGAPLSRNEAAAVLGGKRTATLDAIRRLIADHWLIEVDIPREVRANPSRSSFLVELTADERDRLRTAGERPAGKCIIPPSWLKPMRQRERPSGDRSASV